MGLIPGPAPRVTPRRLLGPTSKQLNLILSGLVFFPSCSCMSTTGQVGYAAGWDTHLNGTNQ